MNKKDKIMLVLFMAAFTLVGIQLGTFIPNVDGCYYGGWDTIEIRVGSLVTYSSALETFNHEWAHHKYYKHYEEQKERYEKRLANEKI